MINQIDNLVKLKNKDLFRDTYDILEDIKEYITNSKKVENYINARVAKKEVCDKFTIDRFEENYAICESENGIFNIKREYLPINAKEGNIIKLNNNKYVIDIQESKQRNKKIESITKDLWSN